MKTDKERVRELLKKIWLEGYTDDNEGIDECKRDIKYIESYIAYLEGIEKKYEDDCSLFSAILNEANIDFVNISTKEIEDNDVMYSIMRYEDAGRIVVSKVIPQKYYSDEELNNDKTN